MQFDSLGQGQELELELCRLYAKKSCKKCYGRGYLIFDTPTQFYKYETRTVEVKDGDVKADSFEGAEPEVTIYNKNELKSTPLPMHWADYCSCTKKGMVKAAQ